MTVSLMWFRNDLRTYDNPALHDACRHGQVVAVFLIADEQWREHDVGPRRLAFLRATLSTLRDSLEALAVPLWIERAPRFDQAADIIVRIARACDASAVYCNAEYPQNELRRDREVFKACRASGIAFERRHGGVILPPGSVVTGQGKPYSVFSPFKRRWLQMLTPDDYTPLPRPQPQAPSAFRPPDPTNPLGQLPQLEQPDWVAGEAEAARRLDKFLDEKAEDYAIARDLPGEAGTSRLSPYLSIGAISARSCLAEARLRGDKRLHAKPAAQQSVDTWISEIIWREFYRHVIAAFPHVSRGAAFRRETDSLPWRTDTEQLDRWREGMTGYPIVDAGMRQLKATGWMHNRVRMITAMFLSKHLLLDWRCGEQHFMHSLIDGDFAANNGGWQWSASTGTDAAPYFRIFNPTSQAKKFDADGKFVLRWVPELRQTAATQTEAPYPPPIVDHAAARQRALDVFKSRR